MGVQCKVLGHVYDATEFEERREDRENGTVLICREYQVCKRCGNRKELYRNEQLLPKDTASGDTQSEPEQQDQAADTPADPAQSVDGEAKTPGEPSGDAASAAETVDSVPGEQTTGVTATPGTDGTASAGGSASESDAEILESPSADDTDTPPEPTADDEPAADTAPPAADSGAEILEADGNGDPAATEQHRDLNTDSDTPPTSTDATAFSPPAEEGGETTDSTSVTAASVDEQFEAWPGESDGSERGRESTPSQRRSDSGPDQTEDDGTDGGEDTDIATPSDDAVILSSSPAETDQSSARSVTPEGDETFTGATDTDFSSLETKDDEETTVCCPECSGSWPRAETSLRDGDLCPECRSGYVEVR